MQNIRALLAIGCALLLGGLAGRADAAGLEALSTTDAQLYAAAFQAAERGDFETVDATLARVNDPCLVGRVQYLKYTQASQARSPSYTDLVGWLKAFKDLPGADRIYALALRLRPADGAEPPAPEAASLDANGQRSRASNQYRPAREAYFDGDLRRALSLAKSSGDFWIAGLASYRLQAFPEAINYFEALARNPGEAEAIRSAGGFWAARSAEAAGRPDRSPELLRLAAALPDTFYGMVAARRLVLTDDPLGRLVDASVNASQNTASALQPMKISSGGLDAPGVLRLIHNDPRARRAIALSQIGRPFDAGQELRTGLAMAATEDERVAWSTLVYALNPNRAPGNPMAIRVAAPSVQGVVYPMPTIAPTGGFTINKSLVYAVSWQESRFDPFVVSPVGAVGVMQVMPPTAARIAGDDTLASDRTPLFDGPTNMRLGQQYLNMLLDQGGGDIMKAVASYNGGPGMVARTEAQLGPNVDALLFMESMPFYETRGYVQKVMAAYWAYQRQFGGKTATLDQVASGGSLIDARLDR